MTPTSTPVHCLPAIRNCKDSSWPERLLARPHLPEELHKPTASEVYRDRLSAPSQVLVQAHGPPLEIAITLPSSPNCQDFPQLISVHLSGQPDFALVTVRSSEFHLLSHTSI